ncbi:MAG: adenylyl-sulfate kinase, partial [Candidatus Omnitrophica bacterium]|nr:adenylyl-sulfate kinase [Candidatus Omnitrophota bacterium]
TYWMKIGCSKTKVALEEVIKCLDASSLEEKNKASVERNDAAECVFKLDQAAAFDTVDEQNALCRFVLVDQYNIAGGGIIMEALHDDQEDLREKLFERNYHWIKSEISVDERVVRYGQKPTMIVITGEKDSPRKDIARHLEQALFQDGRYVYFLGMGSVVHGLDADLENRLDSHSEHVRRLAEMANILLDAGVILIASVIKLSVEDIEILRMALGDDRLEVVWVGDSVAADVPFALKVSSKENTEAGVGKIKDHLQARKIVHSQEQYGS